MDTPTEQDKAREKLFAGIHAKGALLDAARECESTAHFLARIDDDVLQHGDPKDIQKMADGMAYLVKQFRRLGVSPA